MGLRDWLVRRLGGDTPVGDPDQIVEIALVELWQSELIVTELRTEGIEARAVHEHSTVGTREHLRPMARVFARRGDFPKALAVVVRVQQGTTGGDVEWPPVPNGAPWRPPAGDGALP